MMMPRELVADLCRYVIARGWTGSRVAGKAELLCGMGLHPEQAFIGTGLLEADAYGEALSELCGLEFRRLDPVEAIHELPADFFAVPLEESKREITLGFARPWDAGIRGEAEAWAETRGQLLKPVAILWSDWRRAVPSEPSEFRPARRLRELLASADASQVHHVRLERHTAGTGVTFSHDLRRQPDATIGAGPFAALRLRLRRTVPASDWMVHESEQGNGRVLNLSRPLFETSTPHALNDSDVWRSFWQDPEGLLVMQGQDPAWREAMKSAPDSALCFEVNDANASEEALHAALAGKIVLAHADSASEPWWDAAADASIPVRVVRAHHLADGTAWEAHGL